MYEELSDKEVAEYKTLRHYKEIGTVEECRAAVEKQKEVRSKVIDELVEKINHIGYVPVCVDCITKHQIIEIAEQLKGGGANE